MSMKTCLNIYKGATRLCAICDNSRPFCQKNC